MTDICNINTPLLLANYSTSQDAAESAFEEHITLRGHKSQHETVYTTGLPALFVPLLCSIVFLL